LQVFLKSCGILREYWLFLSATNFCMLKKERQAFILHQVNLHNKVLSSSLSQEISVSEDTIRRDLQDLADDGKVIKVHGGALSHSFDHYYSPGTNVYSHSHKKIIAQKAITLIRDGMFVLTTGGTTIIELAKNLPPSLKATFISGSIPVLLEYIRHPTIEVIVIGDKVSKSAKITTGGEAISRIRQIRADICFLGVNAIDANTGLTDNDWDVVQLKKAMIESSRQVVCLSISEKLNSIQPIHVCDLSKVHTLITELPVTDPKLDAYKRSGLQIL
jgi:DeoR/GlpR family transcriptional regulator of sugar metabolism